MGVLQLQNENIAKKRPSLSPQIGIKILEGGDFEVHTAQEWGSRKDTNLFQGTCTIEVKGFFQKEEKDEILRVK